MTASEIEDWEKTASEALRLEVEDMVMAEIEELDHCGHCGHCGRIMENEVPPEPLQRWGNKPMHDGSGVLCRACYFGC